MQDPDVAEYGYAFQFDAGFSQALGPALPEQVNTNVREGESEEERLAGNQDAASPMDIDDVVFALNANHELLSLHSRKGDFFVHMIVVNADQLRVFSEFGYGSSPRPPEASSANHYGAKGDRKSLVQWLGIPHHEQSCIIACDWDVQFSAFKLEDKLTFFGGSIDKFLKVFSEAKAWKSTILDDKDKGLRRTTCERRCVWSRIGEISFTNSSLRTSLISLAGSNDRFSRIYYRKKKREQWSINRVKKRQLRCRESVRDTITEDDVEAELEV